MCGIIAVVRRASDRVPAPGADLLARAEQAAADAAGFGDLPPGIELAELLATVTSPLVELDTALRGSPGVRTLLADASLTPALDRLVAGIEARADGLGVVERTLHGVGSGLDTGHETVEGRGE